ncbi:MAG: tRNA1(Val) (adenine(37)-N6)-methyltransferase [Candidatus Cryptobacteroides sp.]
MAGSMGDNIFRFKHFSVRNERSAMKVGTDGVLLGACSTICGDDISILDAGTGTGTIAMMLAQRYSTFGGQASRSILGIDIDRPSAEEAADNFSGSPWAGILGAENLPLQSVSGTFDLIVSNPPFYDATLPNPDPRKNTARHAASREEELRQDAPLSYRTLLEYASTHLSARGRLSVILPSDCEKDLLRTARTCGLHPFRIIRIRTVPHKAPMRIIAEFSFNRVIPPAEEGLTIQEKGRYTEEYTDLMKEFYLWA